MIFDKETLFILRYIYKHNPIAYGDLKNHFPARPIFDLVSTLSQEGAITYQSVPGRLPNGRQGPMLYDEGKITCTPAGKKYVEDMAEKRNTKIAEWVRYAVTTAIALAAFIKSFFF